MNEVKPLPQAPVLSVDTEKTVRKSLNELYTKLNQVIKQMNSSG